jgi:hypothetical protein
MSYYFKDKKISNYLVGISLPKVRDETRGWDGFGDFP